jgi:hypothetical protein
MEDTMKRLIAAFPCIRKSSLLGIVLFASSVGVNAAHCGQFQPEAAPGLVKVSMVAAAETNRNTLNVGLDNEAYITVHNGELELRLGYSLPDLAKEGGEGTHVNMQGIAPVAGRIMVKLTYSF